MIRPRSLILIAIFFLDVHVKADGHAKKSPAECWGQKIPCAVKAFQGKKVLQADGLRLVLSPGALIEQRTGDTIQLVAGSLYAETSKPLKISTPYGRFWCDGECTALFERREKLVKIKSLGGQWTVERLGEAGQVYGLRSGLQFWLSEVEPGGKAAMEYPQSLPWLATAKDWAALYPGSPQEFKQALVKFRGEWKAAVETASDISLRSAERLIASHQAGLAAAAARRKAQERQEEALRARFREKNYVEF